VQAQTRVSPNTTAVSPQPSNLATLAVDRHLRLRRPDSWTCFAMAAGVADVLAGDPIRTDWKRTWLPLA
jgi:hypothetical protein